MSCPKKGKCSLELHIERKTAVEEDNYWNGSGVNSAEQFITIVTVHNNKNSENGSNRKNYHLLSAF